jgi:hypothetical protein
VLVLHANHDQLHILHCCTCVQQESPVANRIKEAFFSEKGLAGNVQRLPFDKLFSIDSVKKVRAGQGRTYGSPAAVQRRTGHKGRAAHMAALQQQCAALAAADLLHGTAVARQAGRSWNLPVGCTLSSAVSRQSYQAAARCQQAPMHGLPSRWSCRINLY